MHECPKASPITLCTKHRESNSTADGAVLRSGRNTQIEVKCVSGERVHDRQAPNSDRALQRLVDGFGRFRTQHFDEDHHLYDELMQGQHPEVMVIACSDSRTDPAIICGAEPGDLFVIRNVAALVPTYEPDGRPRGTSAAIEFGVKALGVRHIIVLGHSFCAGVRCLVTHDHGGQPFEFVSDWVEVVREVRDEMDGLVTEADHFVIARRAEQAAVLASLRHLMTYPFIADRLYDRSLALHGWYFHFGWGLLQAAETPSGPFRQVDAGRLPPPALGSSDASDVLAQIKINRFRIETRNQSK